MQVHPHLGAGAEVPGQAQRSIGGDAAGAMHDGIEVVGRHVRCLGERLGGQVRRLHELQAQHPSGRDRRDVFVV